jgi:two-component system KDP operon response regulator KdpE
LTKNLNALVIEDESQIPRVLRHPLAAAGFDMSLAETVETGVAAIAESKPDIVLLDLGLGDRDGKDVIRTVREWSDVPIIILSARFDEDEKIAALDLGADDYVNKPFSIGELLARMRTALRRQANRRSGESVLAFEAFEIDFATRRARLRGRDLSLTPREYDLLRVLAQNAGQVVTHKQLLERAWGVSETRDYQIVRVAIAQLRRKLEGAGEAAPAIVTEQGVGYRLQLAEDRDQDIH